MAASSSSAPGTWRSSHSRGHSPNGSAGQPTPPYAQAAQSVIRGAFLCQGVSECSRWHCTSSGKVPGSPLPVAGQPKCSVSTFSETTPSPPQILDVPDDVGDNTSLAHIPTRDRTRHRCVHVNLVEFPHDERESASIGLD